MKYSQYFGIAAAILLISACFIPWGYIASINTTITGVYTGKTSLGKPGVINIIMALLSIVFFIVPTVLAKRINIFVSAFNLAWSVRNFILVAQCEMGECPEKRAGIFLIVAFSAILMLMALFPKVPLKDKNAGN